MKGVIKMANKLNSNQRLTTSSSSYIKQKQKPSSKICTTNETNQMPLVHSSLLAKNKALF